MILGHVDSYLGPGVFFNLKDLRAGATIEVQEGGVGACEQLVGQRHEALCGEHA